MNGGFRAISSHGFGPQPGGRHESRDPTATDRLAGVDQSAVQPWTAVPLVMAREQSNNLGGQASVLSRMVTHSACAPSIEATWRHVEAVTQPRHAELRAVRVDEGERFAR